MNLLAIIRLSAVHITRNSCGILPETLCSLKYFWGLRAKLVAVLLYGVHITRNSCGILPETLCPLKCFWGLRTKACGCGPR